MRSRSRRLQATFGAIAAAGIIALAATSAAAAGQAHENQVDPLRAVLTQYTNFDSAARLADYPAGPVPKVSGPQAGETCIVDPAGSGAMGEHYVNLDYLTDGAIQALRPEAVLYEPQANGSRTLVGVDYIVFKEQWDATHHHAPMLYGQMFMTFDASNPYGLPPFYALHVWTHRANPAGLFAMYNKNVTCP